MVIQWDFMGYYPLVICYIAMERSMGQLAISMPMFNSYVELPEGVRHNSSSMRPWLVFQILPNDNVHTLIYRILMLILRCLYGAMMVILDHHRWIGEKSSKMGKMATWCAQKHSQVYRPT